MDKRGSHVGMVLSFVIFVTFLLFVFSVLQPEIQNDESNKAAIENIEKEIMENISSQMTSFTLSVQESSEEDNCLKINNLIPKEKNVIVKNSKQNILNASTSEKNLKIEGDTERGFFKVYYSNFFEETGISCTPQELGAEEYSISSQKEKNLIFVPLVKGLTNSLENNYESVKNNFNVATNKDFQFALVLENGTEIGNLDNSENLKTNVEFKEWPIQYVGNKANIIPGDLKIKVW